MTAEEPGPEPVGEEPKGNPLDEAKEWANAIVLGIGDTIRDMLRAGRRASHEAADSYWERFDRKTRYRRKREGDRENK